MMMMMMVTNKQTHMNK